MHGAVTEEPVPHNSSNYYDVFSNTQLNIVDKQWVEQGYY